MVSQPPLSQFDISGACPGTVRAIHAQAAQRTGGSQQPQVHAYNTEHGCLLQVWHGCLWQRRAPLVAYHSACWLLVAGVMGVGRVGEGAQHPPGFPMGPPPRHGARSH